MEWHISDNVYHPNMGGCLLYIIPYLSDPDFDFNTIFDHTSLICIAGVGTQTDPLIIVLSIYS